MSGLSSHFEQCGRQNVRKYLFIIGVTVCCTMLVVISNQSEDDRSAYCIMSVLTLLLTEALPAQVTVMMPLFFFVRFEFSSPLDYYLPSSILHLVATILVLASTDSTTLAARAAFFVLGSSGTRLRNVQLACLALSYLLSLLLEETLAVLLMIRLIRKAVDVLQQESIQARHQRELFRKTVARMPALAAQPGVREALLQRVEQDRNPESSSTPDKVRGSFRVPAPGLHSADKPSAPLGGQASDSNVDVPLVVPAISVSISELLVLMKTLSVDGAVPKDDGCLPSSEIKNSTQGPATDLRAVKRDSESSHDDTPSGKPRCTARGTASSTRQAGAQDTLSNTSALDKSSLSLESFETAADATWEKTSASSYDSYMGKKCPESAATDDPGRSSQWTPAGGTAASESVLWKSVLSKVSHCAGAALAPFQSLMTKKSSSSEFIPATALGESAVTEVSATSPSALFRGSTPKSAMLSKSRKGVSKTTTLLHDGKIFLPGDSSPPKKAGQVKKKKLSIPAEVREEVRHIYFWKNERYELIHKELLLSVVTACALASIMNLTSNKGNAEFLLYFRRNFGEESVISTKNWWLLFFPMEIVAVLLHWQFMWMTFLHHFDAPQAIATRVAIRLTIQKRSSELGVVTFAEFVQVILIGIWLAIYCTLFAEFTFNAQDYEKLELDFFIIVALLSFPWSWREQPTTASIRPLVQEMPWGAIITYGSTFTLSFIVKSTKFVAWLRETLKTLEDRGKLLQQALLTVCASLMAELVSSCHTVRILLPVAIETAVAQPCNPLYYALPITVAASSSVILPTARVSIALLSELTDTGPISMLLYGLLLKALVIICVLISVDTLGHQVFNWSTLPSWMFARHMNISHEWRTSGMLP